MKKILILLYSLCLVVLANAQAEKENQQLVVRAFADYTSMNITWYPVESKKWQSLLSIGYTLERQQLDESGNPTGRPTILSNSILPQGQEWFLENKDSDEPLIEPVRSLLFDEEFDFVPQDGLNATDMKFNYIAFEATTNPVIAYGVGLGYVDPDIESGKVYRYTVKANDGSISGFVDIGAFLFTMKQNPLVSPHEFTFPNDLSLSDMYYGNTKIKDNRVVGLARAYGDSIIVRWAPPNALVWESAKKDGFKVYRSEGWGDPELLAEVKPRPKSEMDASLVEQDSMAFLAAGLLYGQFDESEITSLNDRKNMTENYFAMALMAAEQSPQAAEILGFRFIDKEVEVGVEYTYLISTPSLPDLSDAGMISVNNVNIPIEAPEGFYLTPADKSIRLNWSRGLNIGRFSYYKVERSRDGFNFEQVNQAPIVFMDSDLAEFTTYFYVDSVGVNDVPFYYRLSGGNSFGEWSLPAERIGIAVDLTPPLPAQIYFADYQDSLEQFVIDWAPQGELPEDFAYYQIMMSEAQGGLYSVISEELDPTTNSFTLDVRGLELEGKYYFKIASVDVKGNISESTAFPARVPDLTPPDIPVSLRGFIDDDGRVEIGWEPSEATDTRGYWLYWANDPEEEFSLISQDIIEENYFVWQVNDKSLNKQIYICLRVEDEDFNRSNTSEVLRLKRPDKVPPIPPVIQPVSVSEGALKVNWKVSPSDDVSYSLLYKRNAQNKDTTWMLLDTIQIDTGSYRDTMVKIDSAYQYRICSVDDSGNQSDLSAVSHGVLPFPADLIVVSDLKVVSDAGSNRLNWNDLPEHAILKDFKHQFDIYRSTGSGGLERINTIPAGTLSFTDQNVVKDVLYNYAIRIRFDNGWVGDLSEVKSILVQ
jgi:hypothetical protein